MLDKLDLEADFIPGDIGWEFWRQEGDAFPPRTIELLKNVDAAMFGAITSKPVKAAEAELAPELQGKGLTYRSPIVRMRQMFDLYICQRPVQGLPRQPPELQRGHRPGRVPGKHGGPVFGGGVQPGARRSWPNCCPGSRNPSPPSKTCRPTSMPFRPRSTPEKARSASSGRPSISPASTGARR